LRLVGLLTDDAPDAFTEGFFTSFFTDLFTGFFTGFLGSTVLIATLAAVFFSGFALAAALRSSSLFRVAALPDLTGFFFSAFVAFFLRL
jgi:hypothetical protein